MSIKLNLGCGDLPLQGFVNIDISPMARADKVLDITKGLPYEDNEVDVVNAGCVLEQIDSNKDFIFVLNEIWRVLKKDGLFTGYVPSTDQRVLYQDPMDRRFFQEESFNYFIDEHHYYLTFGKNYGFKPWQKVEIKTNEYGIIFFTLKK